MTIDEKRMITVKHLFLLLLISIIIPLQVCAQTQWKSENYFYSLEIPEGFNKTTAIGKNVDFKALKGNNSVVVVVKSLPAAYSQNSIWEIMGNLTTYGDEWEYGAREYMNNPQFLKYGKTLLDGEETFWYDYTTDSPKLYSKVYQTQKSGNIYTFTLTTPFEDYNYYSPIWLRFKENVDLK